MRFPVSPTRSFAGMLLAGGALAIASGAVWAHAALVQSDPAADSTAPAPDMM